MPRFTSHPLPIGLDVDADVVRLIQLRVQAAATSAAACTVQAAATEPVTGGEIGVAVRRALATHRFNGLDVVACLPREVMHVRSVRVAGPVDDAFDGRVLDAAAAQFPFPIDTARVQVLSAGPVRDGDRNTCEAIVLAVRHDDIDAFLLPLHDAGLRVKALDCPLTALFRGIDRFGGDAGDDEMRFIVELGRQQSHVIIATGRDIQFYKTIDSGTAQLARAVSRKLGITIADAEALRRRLIARPADAAANDPVRQAVFDATRGVAEQFARELVLCQRYYSVMFRGRPARTLELAGASASDASLHRIFSAMLGLEAVTLRPPLTIDTTGYDIADGSWAAAFGAALKFAPAMPVASASAEIAEPVVIDSATAAPEVARA